MSARVINPVIMSEMRRMLCGGSGVVAYSENGAQIPAAVAPSRRGPDGVAVARVKRDLFGPVDHEDSRRFVDRELSAQQKRDSERWGFDFVRGSPKKNGPGSTRYDWKKVTPQEKIPEPYALRRMAYLSRCTVDDAAPTPATTATEVVSTNSSVQEVASATNNKQMRITDFMKSRKRTSNLIKPTAMAPPTEAKKARLGNS